MIYTVKGVGYRLGMPRVSPDNELSQMLAEYVRYKHNGNKAGASKALSITRPVMYRALRGSVTKATGGDLRAKLQDEGVTSAAAGGMGEADPAEAGAELRDISMLALQVLRFMTQAVQHERTADRGSSGA